MFEISNKDMRTTSMMSFNVFIVNFEHGTIIRIGVTCKKNPLLYARLSLQVVYCLKR